MDFEVESDFQKGCSEINVVTNTIDVIDYQGVSYNDFVKKYLYPNVPCLIRNVTEKWESAQKWVLDLKPNIDYLQEKYGENQVTIYDCSERYFNSQKTNEMTLKDYLKSYWNNSEERNTKLLYLKDWHLKLQHKEDNFYEVPIYFASDWLNEYHTSCLEDDYQFVYMGPKDSWTPFHADVFSSYSWSVNVCGRKKWVLFPPGEENKLRDNFGNLPYRIPDSCGKVKCFVVFQNAGEAIFVPSGWYHQVWNLEDTISINHNWVNAFNIKIMWDSLNINLANVKKEIEDCRDMDNFEEHCQIMLKSLFGINHEHFFKFLHHIAKERIKMIQNLDDRILFHGYKMGSNHIKFDLERLHDVFENFSCFASSIKASYDLDIQQILCLIKESLMNF